MTVKKLIFSIQCFRTNVLYEKPSKYQRTILWVTKFLLNKFGIIFSKSKSKKCYKSGSESVTKSASPSEMKIVCQHKIKLERIFYRYNCTMNVCFFYLKYLNYFSIVHLKEIWPRLVLFLLSKCTAFFFFFSFFYKIYQVKQ